MVFKHWFLAFSDPVSYSASTAIAKNPCGRAFQALQSPIRLSVGDQPMTGLGVRLLVSSLLAISVGMAQADQAVAVNEGQAFDHMALGQVGFKEVNGCNCGPDIDKFTQAHHEPWCADFVSWVYKQAGHPFSGGVDGWRIASAESLRQWFVQRGWYHPRTSADVPQSGDVVSFVHSGTGSDHTGIVDRVEGTTLYTVEGNTSNGVYRRSYPNFRNNRQIMGWGRLNSGSPVCSL
jgi:hypothetical protein